MASLPYPRRPLKSSHRIHGIHRSFWRRRASHRFHRFHRWLGCVGFSHGIHGTHRSFWWRRASHRWHRCAQMVRLRRVLPRNSRNSQKFLAEKSLPRMRTDAHRWLGCVGFCGKIVWCLRGYGRMPYPPNLCTSVQSVG